MTTTAPIAHLPRTLWRSVAALLLLGTLGLWLTSCSSPPLPPPAYCAQLTAIARSEHSTSNTLAPAKLKAQLKSGEAVVAKLVATAPTATLRSDSEHFAHAVDAYYTAAAATGFHYTPALNHTALGAFRGLVAFGTEVSPWQKAHCSARAT